MKSKQLANVLIKILGLSVCLYGIPSFVSGFLKGLFYPAATGSNVPSQSWVYTVGSLVYLVMGIFLILRSRYVAEKLFKGEDE